MLKIPAREIEEHFTVKLVPSANSLGLDCASRTGWAKAHIENGVVTFDSGFVNVHIEDRTARFDRFIAFFKSLITPDLTHIVIEESFFGQNIHSYQFLSRLGMIAYYAAYDVGTIRREFLTAAQARKALGLKGTAKKQLVQRDFLSRLRLTVEDEDIVDAMILAICGLRK